MARTRQAPRQSTGGRAPRGVFATPNTSTDLPKKWRLWREAEDTSQPEPLPEARARLSASPELLQTSLDVVNRDLTRDSDIAREKCDQQTRKQIQCAEGVDIEEDDSPMSVVDMRDHRASNDFIPHFARQKEDSTLKQEQVKERTSCMLLHAIPCELREIIFNDVLGTQTTIHLISRANRLGHLYCLKTTLNPHALCWRCALVIEKATYLWPRDEREKVKLSKIDLSLLQTCRQAYREGVHLLYSRPIFNVQHPETLNWLKLTVPPQRLSTITKLSISLDEAASLGMPTGQTRPFRVKNPHNPRARNPGDLLRYWDPAWRTILCDMHGLKRLTVTLRGNKYSDAEYTEPVLKPLLELRGLITFQFRLEGKLRGANEPARIEMLRENSSALRTILEMATSERTGRKRKADELDWRLERRSKRLEALKKGTQV